MKRFILNSSIDGQSLHCVDFCEGVENPKIVLQICHGMQEHILRYEDFASFLGENGIKVFGMDNRGHGKTGEDMGILGHISDENGYYKLPEDVNDLNIFLKEKYPNSKIVIFGHSMGSIIVRNFLNKYSKNVDGAIICGTVGLFKFIHSFGLFLARLMTRFLGNRKKLKFLNIMPFKNHNKKIENLKTDVDWICRDEKVLEEYIKDEYCGFPCTNSFFVDLLKMVKNLSLEENVQKVDKELPMFFISGSDDPVGEYENGVLESFNLYKKVGVNDLNIKLYPKMRHEILNELGKEEVYTDILNFLRRI